MAKNGKSGHALPDEKPGQTIDHETQSVEGPPPTCKRRIDLSSLRDVRIELAAVYRKIDAGEIESSDGSRRAYVLKTIGDIIELSELERRIAELEERKAAGSPPALPSRTLN